MDKVLDVKYIGNSIYGYCSCGRELKKETWSNESECPLCQKILKWEDLKDGN